MASDSTSGVMFVVAILHIYEAEVAYTTATGRYGRCSCSLTHVVVLFLPFTLSWSGDEGTHVSAFVLRMEWLGCARAVCGWVSTILRGASTAISSTPWCLFSFQ